MPQTQFKIEGMTCNHCVHTIQKTLASLSGIEKVEVLLASKKAIVTHKSTLEQAAVIQALEQEGYKASLFT